MNIWEGEGEAKTEKEQWFSRERKESERAVKENLKERDRRDQQGKDETVYVSRAKEYDGKGREYTSKTYSTSLWRRKEKKEQLNNVTKKNELHRGG